MQIINALAEYARNKWVVIIAGLALTASTVAKFFADSDTFPYHTDLAVYRGGAEQLLQGISLYSGSVETRFISLPFTYPPISAIAFTPLTLVPIEVSTVLLFLATIVALWVVMALIIWRSGKDYGKSIALRDSYAVSFLLLPVVIWFEPVASTLGFGQLNVLLMLLVALDLLLPKTPWPRGLLIGLAAALKLTPAVFGLIFLLRKDWRGAATTVLSALFFTSIAFAVTWHDSVQYWTETIHDPSRIGGLAYAYNQSFRGFLTRLVPDSSLQVKIWFFGVIVLIALVTYAMWLLLREGSYVAAVCTNALVALLASPVTWSHHWVWLVPMVIVAAIAWSENRYRIPGYLAIFGFLICTFAPIHTWYPSTDDVELTWSLAMNISGSEQLVFGVAWLLAVIIVPKAFAAQRPISLATS